MKLVYRALLLTVSLLTSNYLSNAQELGKGIGIGISFHAAAAKTDVGGFEPRPITRIFMRYHPLKNFAIESGLGFGMLEGNKVGFFSSKIIPVDVRFVFYPKSAGRIFPLFFGGFSIMNFNPVDEHERPLPNNKRGLYTKWMAVIPVGGGLQYFITDNSIVELVASYSLGTKDYLDDVKLENNNDGYYSFGLNVYAFFESGDADPDGDKLTNNEEKQIGTNPNNPDTDGDKLRDGEEVKIYSTNPLKKDTDDDGLTDYDEIFKFKTDPLNADTDGDGLSDGIEVLKYFTNPLNVDTDGDGLNDGEEVLKHKTDPLNRDTDGEGLTDSEEVLKYLTDPLNVDTDADGLSDYEETFTYHTNPLVTDTDIGGVFDGKEVARGTDPLNPKDDFPVIQVGEKIVLKGITFEFGKARLLQSSIDTLNVVADGLVANPEIEVEISGHTDNVGSAKANISLSLRRAESVKQYLVSRGVNSNRITTVGYGFDKPVTTNGTDEGKSKNRRIEFVRTK
jgi:outer membrane protein OmpA-like peptidoglycan-associated protein